MIVVYSMNEHAIHIQSVTAFVDDDENIYDDADDENIYDEEDDADDDKVFEGSLARRQLASGLLPLPHRHFHFADDDDDDNDDDNGVFDDDN